MGGVNVVLHSFLSQHWIKKSGQPHIVADVSPRKKKESLVALNWGFCGPQTWFETLAVQKEFLSLTLE